MNATPNDKSPGNPAGDSNRTDDPPTPSEVLAILLNWLRHYWDAPRHKAKWTEGATVILTLFVALAAIWSAWVFDEQLRVMRDEANRSHLPLVGVVGDMQVVQPLRFEQNGTADVGVKFSVKNFGNSTALAAMETTMLVIGPLPTPEQAGKLLPCKKEIRIGDEGRLVFSGESFGIGPHSVPSMAINDDKIRLNSDGTASAWLTVCSTYKDESGKPHGTAITWFYATPDDKHNFRPSETVEGKFYPLGAGAVTY